MANQPSKYNKFLLGAASAALVASAVAPVASAATADFSDIKGNTHEAAIKALVEAKVINGYEDGTFKPNKTLTRSDVVKMMGKWLVSLGYEVPADYKTKPRFTDQTTATNDELLKYSAVVKDNGVFNGNDKGALDAAGDITRENMALVLVRAYNTIHETDLVAYVGAQEFKKDVTDRAAAKAEARPYIDVLDFFDITNPAAPQFNPKNTTTRGQFASFLHKTSEVSLEADVAAVSATNATTLTVTGKALAGLKVEDITVENNTVESVTVAEDGKSATVKLADPLLYDTKTKVTIKDVEFEVSYTIEAKGVSVVENQVFDNDTEKQFIKAKVDGKEVTSHELITAGYTVEFEAFERRNGQGEAGADLFKSNNQESTTGELKDLIELDGNSSKDFYVRVTLTKGSEVLVSPVTKITVRNLDAAVSSISNATIKVDSDGGKFPSVFDLASSTLAAGDTAEFTEITATVSGSQEIVKLSDIPNMYTVKSSDESVVSVDKSDYTFTAEGPGTATITLTYGGKTYTKSLTVKSEQRKIQTAKIDKTSLTVGENASGSFKVQIVDQYGDPMNVTKGTDFTVQSSDDTIASVTEVADASGSKLEYKVTVKGEDTGTTDFTIRNAADTRIGSSVRVNVTENATIAKYTLTVDNSISGGDVTKVVNAGGTDATKNNVSTTSTIDTRDQKYVKIDVKAFNNRNQALSAPDADTDFEVIAVNASAADVLAAANDFGDDFAGVVAAEDYLIVKGGSEEGTVTITIADQNNPTVRQTITLKVTDKGVTVDKVSFKNVQTVDYATTLDFEDFLTYTKGNGDTRINGLTLTRSYSQAVRLAENAAHEANKLTDVDTLYVDINGNSQYDAGDIVIGYTQMTTTGDVYVGGNINSDVVPASVGFPVQSGSDGNVIFRVYNDKEEIVATKAVKVDF